MKLLKLAGLAALSVTVAMAGVSAGLAQAYPTKPITVVVPYPPGGSTDTAFRIMQPKLQEILGQPVVIENRGGSSGNVGAAHVARATPDGYTLLFTVNPPVSLNKFIFKKLGYDPATAFTPIVEAARTLIVLAANPSAPFDTTEGLIKYAKAHPGELKFGSSGVGSAHHIAGEVMKKNAGINIVHVPYHGGGPSMADAVGGHIPLVFATLPAAIPQAKAGKIKLIALAETKRAKAYPDLPTIAETVPGVGIATWLGLLGPANLPKPIVDKLNAAVNEALKDPKVVQNLDGAGVSPEGGTSTDFNDLIQSDLKNFAVLLPSIGINPR
ncbi:MAG: tripartite tricarboxylate transporter substrate binding protein [Pseudolabrys sp.]|nr:tripartite tricarboxylate transporter substrate binding protein [Pseudolabrys sp.]